LGNDNSISFVTSDPGTFDQATADWDFKVKPSIANTSGVGMSFALLNTANYGTSGPASSLSPQTGIYNGSLGFGFDTVNNVVTVSMNAAIVTGASLGQLILASDQYIHAHAVVSFTAGTVSLVLTPSVGTPVNVFNGTIIPGLGPYQSRVSYEAANSSTSVADFSLANVNVVYTGIRQPGTIAFGSSNYVVDENAGVALIDIVRSEGTAGAFVIDFVSADGTARNGLNYQAVSGSVSFGEGEKVKTVAIPIINDGVFDGNKTVNLYISNPSLQAPLGRPIASTLTIINTNPFTPPPTVSPKVQLVYAPRTRKVRAFRLTFSTPMAAASAENVQNYTVLTPANKYQPKRTIAIAQAVLDPGGTVVTLYRLANDRVHLSKSVRIIVRGSPLTGLTDTAGTYLGGVNGQAGTDAELVVSI